MPSEAPFSPDDFTSSVSAITSAFGDPTRRRVYLLAHEHEDGVTASEVAAALGLHANVARHHLDKLAAGGYVTVRTAKQTGAAGRPSKRYVATAPAVAIDSGGVRRDELVLALLGRALELLPREQAEAMAEEVGVEYGQRMAASLAGGDAHRSFRAALGAVADALTAHGFAAHTEARGDVVSIVAEHCPFGGASVVSPVVCALDRGMVKGMLGALYGDSCRPETERSRALGDDTCVTGVRVSL